MAMAANAPEAEHGDQPADYIRSHIIEDATAKIQEACDDLKTEVNIFQRDRNHFMDISKKLEYVHFPSIIRLDVGGIIYKTTMDTLKKDPNSMLAAMFSGRFNISKDENGAYFIDRDGKLFRHVLFFLRTGKLQSKKFPEYLKDGLFIEAEFYQIQGLIDILNPLPLALPIILLPIVKDSKIMQEEFRIHFKQWLPEDQFEWKLIYSGSNNGWKAFDFHRCCDGKSPTITLAQAKSSGYIFGGYTDQPWQSPTIGTNISNAVWTLSNKNFLFSILNGNGVSPVKFPAKDANGASYQHHSYGPCFGSKLKISLDMCISSDANSNSSSYSRLGPGYNCSGQDNAFLAGSSEFSLDALEVFSLDV